MGNLSYPDKSLFSNYYQKQKVLSFPLIFKVIQKHSKDCYLNLKGFNDCLNELISDPMLFPILPYSYLSERLFRLIDRENRGLIDQELFRKGLFLSIANKDFRMYVMFEVMKSNPNQNYLTFDDFFHFFYNTWQSSFSYIYNALNYYKKEFYQNNIPLPNDMNDFVSIINKHRNTLRDFLIQNLYDSGIDSQQHITYERFTNWIVKDNTIEITYASKIFRFATSILFMEKIGINTEITG